MGKDVLEYRTVIGLSKKRNKTKHGNISPCFGLENCLQYPGSIKKARAYCISHARCYQLYFYFLPSLHMPGVSWSSFKFAVLKLLRVFSASDESPCRM